MKFIKKRTNVKIFLAVIAVIFSLATAFTGTFAWFSLNKHVEASGMSVKVKNSNFTVSSSAYKYNIPQDRAILVTGDNARKFSLNQYDVVFTSLNQYDSLYFKLTLNSTENSELSSTGNITLTIERQLESTPVELYSTLPTNFTSVTKYAIKGHGALSGGIETGTTSLTWSNLQTAFYQQDKAGNLSTQTFTSIVTGGYTKSSSISLSYNYGANDFYNGSLVIFLYINYDQNLVQSFVEEHNYDMQNIGDTMNHTLANDLQTLSINI